jgi:hypothetical protein
MGLIKVDYITPFSQNLEMIENELCKNSQTEPTKLAVSLVKRKFSIPGHLNPGF